MKSTTRTKPKSKAADSHQESIYGQGLVIGKIADAIHKELKNVDFSLDHSSGIFTTSRLGQEETPLGCSENAAGIKAALDHVLKHISSEQNPIRAMRITRSDDSTRTTWELELHINMPMLRTRLAKLFKQK